MQCGHCGTEVAEGFTVCTGCGAHYRPNFGAVGFGILFTTISVLAFFNAKNLGGKEMLALAALGLFGILLIGQIRRKLWYRQNS